MPRDDHTLAPVSPPTPFALRIAVAGCALAGALALAMTARVGDRSPALALAAAVLAVAGVLVYAARPRVGAAALVAVGALTSGSFAFALVIAGADPERLVGFWGGGAVLLAGLMHAVGHGDARIANATVLAVVSLLVLSALGLGEYLRSSWTVAEREVLESVPIAAPRVALDNTSVTGFVEDRAARGAWAGRWSVTTTDTAGAWACLLDALEADGWRVVDGEAGRGLTCERRGFTLRIESEEPEHVRPGPSKYRVDPRYVRVQMSAYVSAQ